MTILVDLTYVQPPKLIQFQFFLDLLFKSWQELVCLCNKLCSVASLSDRHASAPRAKKIFYFFRRKLSHEKLNECVRKQLLNIINSVVLQKEFIII